MSAGERPADSEVVHGQTRPVLPEIRTRWNFHLGNGKRGIGGACGDNIRTGRQGQIHGSEKADGWEKRAIWLAMLVGVCSVGGDFRWN